MGGEKDLTLIEVLNKNEDILYKVGGIYPLGKNVAVSLRNNIISYMVYGVYNIGDINLEKAASDLKEKIDLLPENYKKRISFDPINLLEFNKLYLSEILKGREDILNWYDKFIHQRIENARTQK